MPEAKWDDGILDFEIIDTHRRLIGWANLFGDVLHQTVTGKAQQSPLSTNSTVDQIQGVSAEVRLEKPALAEVDGDILRETSHIRFTRGTAGAHRARAGGHTVDTERPRLRAAPGTDHAR